MKRTLLAIALACSFLAGFGVAAEAWPVHGRDIHRGYFTNAYDTAGWEVLPACSGCGGSCNYWNGNSWCNSFPNTINSASSFINFVVDRANGGYPARDTVGAQFIIHTAIGTPDGQRNRPPSAAQYQDFTDRINTAANAGRIQWSVNYNFNINSYYQGGSSGSPNDDAFYNENNDGLAIVISNPGGSPYVIRRQCANPVGVGDIPSVSSSWSMSGRTTIDNENDAAAPSLNVTAAPGETVRFRHYLRDDGPGATLQDIWFAILNAANGTEQGGQNSGSYASGEERLVDSDETITINPAVHPAGTVICRKILWDWANSAGARNGIGPQACVTVANDFNLVPSISTGGKTTVQDGESVTFDFLIDNESATTSPSVNCTITGSQPAGIPVSPATSCPRTFVGPGGAISVATQTITVSGQAPGGQICRTLTVAPASATVASRPSPQVCVTIVKTPYVHFFGGDVWAGGGFKNALGACPVTSNKITTVSRSLGGASGNAGSMVEYGAFAQGAITQFGSASRALLTGAPLGSLARSLSFANTSGTPGTVAAPTRCIDDFAAQYASVTQPCPGTVNVNAPPTNPCRTAGNITMPAGALAGGSRQIYIVGGDVNITGSLTYPATYSGQSNIPSLVVIATGNIRVNGSVRQLDGIFITRGTFFTCQEKPPLPTATCNQDLSVNGSVIAKNIDLYRTAGAEGGTPTARRAPAEIFNLRPELFLRNGLNDTTKTTITTSESRELPPRF